MINKNTCSYCEAIQDNKVGAKCYKCLAVEGIMIVAKANDSMTDEVKKIFAETIVNQIISAVYKEITSKITNSKII